METDTAGLDACRAIREELGNRYVRILLRTGQPGAAPERATIDDYDIDGYLPKAELTTTRLYAAVRTALKAFDELVDLDRHRRALLLLNETAVVPPPLRAARGSCSSASWARSPPWCPRRWPWSASSVQRAGGEPLRTVVHLSTSSDDDDPAPAAAAAAAAERIQAYLADQDEPEAGSAAEGYVVPFTLHEGLGEGWLFVDGVVRRRPGPLGPAAAGRPRRQRRVLGRLPPTHPGPPGRHPGVLSQASTGPSRAMRRHSPPGARASAWARPRSARRRTHVTPRLRSDARGPFRLRGRSARPPVPAAGEARTGRCARPG